MLNNLKEARFRARKVQAKLWHETGIHFSTISRIECGYMEPTKEQILRLARALKVEPDWLFPRVKSGANSKEEDHVER